MAFQAPQNYSPRRLTHIVPGTKQRVMVDKDTPSFPDLFCTKCIRNKLIVQAYGFCKVCRDFYCQKCARQHDETLMTLNHGLVVGQEFLERYRHASRRDRPQASPRRTSLGMVATGRASIDYVHQSENRQSVINSVTRNVKRNSELKVQVSTDYRKSFICACIFLEDGYIILADANNKNLKLFNKYFKCLSVFAMKKEPWDLSASLTSGSKFYVTEAHIKGVHQFQSDCREIQYIKTVKVDGECFGVTSLKDDCVAISVKVRGKFEIRLLDQYGNILRKFTQDSAGFKIRSPWYLCSLKGGTHIIISDVEACSITCIDTDGNVDFVFKNRSEMNDPRNITTDDFDNIYVVDYETDTVRQVTARGEDAGVILCHRDGLASPCGLAWAEGVLLIQAKMDSKTMQTFLVI